MQSSETTQPARQRQEPSWWRHAVIYQIYPRSFADSDGDGIGDLQGIRDRMSYLARLGVDAIWLSPFYRSPQADAGYDVSDYRDVDPLFGDLDEFDKMLSRAHESGLKVIVDLVPNHTSDEHVWFKEALASPAGSPARDRYIFRKGKGANSELPPNNWQSMFGGSAWTRVDDTDQWYLHMFDTKQPDLNWHNPEVHEEFIRTLRFWLDRGVDGFRVDVAHGLIKKEGLPDAEEGQVTNVDGDRGPMWDQDGVHDIYREWRKVLDEYDGDRSMVAEAWVSPERMARYIRSDEMCQAFNFPYMMTPWNADAYRRVIQRSLDEFGKVNAPSTWVLSNHDVTRHATRFGMPNPGTVLRGISLHTEQPDEVLGLRRARASIFMTLGLPGSAYIYQGEELGLPENTTMDDSFRQDPTYFRTNGKDVGRDGCRVPIPWKAKAPAYGFGPDNSAHTWLPQPDSFARYAIDVEEKDPLSTLALYRRVLKLRQWYDLGNGEVEWLDAPHKDVLMFRNRDVIAVINMGDQTVPLPDLQILAQSQPETMDGLLPGNSAVWMFAHKR